MKKSFGVFLLPLLVTLVLGCATTGSAPQQDPNTPVWLNDFPPEDVMWGIGSAKQSSDNLSMTMAEARARQNIAQQLSTLAKGMITDYARDAGTTNNQSSLNLAESVSQQLTQATLNGVTPRQRWKAPDGTWWYLVEYKKADAARAATGIIDNEAARYAEFKAMNSLDAMEKKLAEASGKPVPVTE